MSKRERIGWKPKQQLFTIHNLLFTNPVSRCTMHRQAPTPPAFGRAQPLTPTFESDLLDGSAMTERDKKKPAAVSTAEMNALIADYEAKIDEAAELITRVRHEINNPLTGVLGQAQLLLREDLNERARKRAETIEELAIRMRDIVAQLRQVQRPPKKSSA